MDLHCFGKYLVKKIKGKFGWEKRHTATVEEWGAEGEKVSHMSNFNSLYVYFALFLLTL